MQTRDKGPRPKQTRNRAAQRAGAEIDLGCTQLGNWLVGGELSNQFRDQHVKEEGTVRGTGISGATIASLCI